MEEKIYLAFLHSIGFTQKKLFELFKEKQNFKEVYNNINFEYLRKIWFSEKKTENIIKYKNNLSAQKIKNIILMRNVKIIYFLEEDYPENLKNISNPPFVLYVRGELNQLPKIAVVGARKISTYGEKTIDLLIPEISKYFSIVSWWAIWCDTYAHKSCILSKGKTISVIWTGIDIDYPVNNHKLYNEIAKNWGAVIFIFPIGELWNPYNFPIRNEIVAWLSEGVLVIEAKEKSGTLITANLALEMWKELFVVPWDIFRLNSQWCNNLIKSWSAKSTSSSDDIFTEFNINSDISENKPKKIITFNDSMEEKIYNVLLREWFIIDELSKKLTVTVSELSFKLSMMEISGLIKKWIWWKYEVL